MREVNTAERNRIFIFDSSKEIADFAKKDFYIKDRAAFIGRQDIKSMEDAKKAAEQAWKEGMEVLTMFTERLAKLELPELKSRKRTFTWDTEGDEVDIERMMAGEAKCWKKWSREETSGPCEVTVVIDTTTPFHMDSMDILWRGAAALALTKLLEEKGYRVELWVVNGSHLFWDKPSIGVMTACCLKKTSDPMDLSTMLNTVSGWFYRTLTFALLEAIGKHCNEAVNPSYGHCHEPRPSDLREISKDENLIYSSGVFTFSGAASLIEAEIARIADTLPKE